MAVTNCRIATALAFTCLLLWGCAEGPLWRTGGYVPWARDKWQAEEEIAQTSFERKRQLNDMVDRAKAGSTAEKSSAASQLAEVVQRDPVLLMRLHAVALLGQLDSPQAIETLKLASRDSDSQVRLAAVNSWKAQPAAVAVAQLQEIIGSDTDVDVRLAATRVLGDFSGRDAVNALSLALTDSNPAIQFRATESLEKITGERIGVDVASWQSYIAAQSGESEIEQTAKSNSKSTSTDLKTR